MRKNLNYRMISLHLAVSSQKKLKESDLILTPLHKKYYFTSEGRGGNKRARLIYRKDHLFY